MYHYLQGEITNYGSKILLRSDLIGIEIIYPGKKSEGEFFLYPYIDDNHKTIFYYAFDSIKQKIIFEKMLKISGIGPKIAINIARINEKELQQAIEEINVQFFQSIPGVGPKLAKKLCIELKHSFSIEDTKKLHIDEKLLHAITVSLKNLGYDSKKIKPLISKCPLPMNKDHLTDIIKRIIEHI